MALNKDLLKELEWLNKVALKHLKNYQIWYLTAQSQSFYFVYSLLKAPPSNHHGSIINVTRV